MIRRFFANEWIAPFFILSIFYLTQLVLNKHLKLSNASVKQLVSYASNNGLISLINNPIFWSSGLGNTLKILVEILLTSSLLYVAARILYHKASWKKYLVTVSYAQFAFLLQHTIEFAFMKTQSSVLQANDQQTLGLMSLNQLFHNLNVRIPHFFEYASLTLSLFELLYWLVLSWLLSKFTSYPLKSCFAVVLSGYVTVLLCWLLLISFFLLLNS